MCIRDRYYPELAGILFQLAVRVQKATGVHIGYINLSGGVGIPYRPEQTENDIMEMCIRDSSGPYRGYRLRPVLLHR